MDSMLAGHPLQENLVVIAAYNCSDIDLHNFLRWLVNRSTKMALTIEWVGGKVLVGGG